MIISQWVDKRTSDWENRKLWKENHIKPYDKKTTYSIYD